MVTRKYRGFCSKYGIRAVLPVAYVLPPILCTIYNAATNDIPAPIFLIGGIFGVGAAMMAHGASNVIGDKMHLGARAGGKFARASQLAAYLLVAGGITAGAYVMNNKDLDKDNKVEPKVQNIESDSPKAELPSLTIS